MFLTDEELSGLTGRKRRDAQVRALRFMGIEHRLRPDGSVAVLRAHVEDMFGLALTGQSEATAEMEPDWSAI